MFEEAQYNYIKDNFSVSGFDIEVFYGEAPESQEAPYIVQYSLDTDGTKQVLCEDNDYSYGEAFMQWNIYTIDPKDGFYIKRQLETFLSDLNSVTLNSTQYMIQLNQHEASPSNIGLTNGLNVDILARTFTYNTGD